MTRPIAYSAPAWIRAGGPYPLCGEWLAGDLHVHSTWSHESWDGTPEDEPGPSEPYTLGSSVAQQFQVAALRGLDFLALTDHNNLLSVDDPGFGGYGVVRAEVVVPDGAEERASVCDGLFGDQTTYCRNRLSVLAFSSALHLDRAAPPPVEAI